MSMTQRAPHAYPHVAVLVFPFTCHPWPLLNLACKLACAAPHIRFSFFNTSKSNHMLFENSQADHLPDNLKAYDVSNGAPEGHVNTLAKPGEDDGEFEMFMKAAPRSFRKAVDTVVAETGMKISCLLVDAFLAFSCKMAQNMHAMWVPFWVAAPYCLSAHIYTDFIHDTYANNGDHGVDVALDLIPGLSRMRLSDLPEAVLEGGGSNSSTFSSNLYRMSEVLAQASVVVINSFQELNSTLLTNDLKSKFQHLLYVGFLTLTLPPPPLPPSHSDATGCLSWLDQQKPSSVAYISFGTLAAVAPTEFVALAEALEASGVPFLWSLREKLKQLLPNGFVQRTSASMQGKISMGTAESKVPMICTPIWGDNKMNGRMVEDVWGIGVRVEGGMFTKNGMLKSLELVLGVPERGKRKEDEGED
uniref:Glycosyltransferase n=1 Tax=Fagus sylvatica TaxID=28930 RepID=A0A2N9H254_FAGSY